MQKLSLLLIAATLVPLSAHAAPQDLYGRTVKVTWTKTRSQRNPGETSFHPVGIPFTYEAYVSSQGNLFKRLTAGGLDRPANRLEGLDRHRRQRRKRCRPGKLPGQYHGGHLIVRRSGGRRIRIVLDSSFSSCSAEVFTGKSGASPASVVSIATGQTVQFESVSAGAASCSIQTGNAFAN